MTCHPHAKARKHKKNLILITSPLEEFQPPDSICILHKQHEIGKTHPIVYPDHVIFSKIFPHRDKADLFEDEVDLDELSVEGREEFTVPISRGKRNRFQCPLNISI